MPPRSRKPPLRRRDGGGRTSPAAPLDARSRLLESALAEFAEHGFDGTTTRDIARRAGVNLGLLQYYFGGKDRLWRAAVDRAFEPLWAALHTAPDAASTAEELPALIRAAVHFAAGQPALIRLMNDEGKREGPRLRWLVERHGRRLYQVAVDVLRAAGSLGILDGVAPVQLYYTFIGAAGLIFSQAAECRQLCGIDPTADAALVEAHAGLVARLFLGAAAAR